MEHHLYLSLVPESLVVSMLLATEFENYLAPAKIVSGTVDTDQCQERRAFRQDRNRRWRQECEAGGSAEI